MWEMQYKPIENCHMKNLIVRKDFNLDATNSFFHAHPWKIWSWIWATHMYQIVKKIQM